MARIRWIEESAATGEIGAVYAAWMQANPGRTAIPEILKALSQRPKFLRQMDDLSDEIHFTDGHLDRRTKEMIATYVSALNQTPYCTGSHARFLREIDPDPVLNASLRALDLTAAPLSGAELGLLEFAATVTHNAHRTTDGDIDRLRALGWTDAQIAEAVYVTALFAFFNRVANAFGLADPTQPGAGG